MRRKLLSITLVAVFVLSLIAGCGSTQNGSGTGTNTNGGEQGVSQNAGGNDIKGEITVITQRTDIVDTVFKEYAKKFNEKYPNVTVKFEAIADYEGQISIRMNTKDYGDVLLIPTSIPIADIPDFFEPLGDLADMQQKYLGIEERAVNGKVYGIPIAINYSGIVYNKKVFEKAGVTKVPTTPDEFIAALEKVKENTDAIPLYTNYAAGWPLTQWEAVLPTVAGDPDYVNITQVNEQDNFVPGKPHYELYKLMYDVAKKGLIEKDPTTTDWENSKRMMAQGKIATMVLGSWAIGQIQGFAENPDDIGYMPFPTNAKRIIFPLVADYNLAINVNSKNKPAAKAWLDWFIHESNYATEQAYGLSPVKDAPLPEALKQFEGTNIEFVFNTPAKPGQEGLVDKIDKAAEIGLWQPDFKKRIIEAAIGNTNETYDEIMKDLNDRWVKARAEIMK